MREYNVFGKPRAEGKSRSVCAMPRRENEGSLQKVAELTSEETNVIIRDDVEDYFLNLLQVVAGNTTLDFALRYVKGLRQEIARLSYLAPMLPSSQYGIAKLYHPQAKTITIGKHRLTVIFHIDGDYVIVDRILPSSMMTY